MNHGIEKSRANQVFWEARGGERRSVRVAEEKERYCCCEIKGKEP